MDAVTPAAERLFRQYYRHCTSPNEDTLLNYLESLHSLNDKLAKANVGNLYSYFRFDALKALRNFFHHEAELIHEVKFAFAAGLSLITDLQQLCLVDRRLIDLAFAKIKPDKRRQAATAFGYYGAVVNIEPAIFNMTVEVFEHLAPLELKLHSDEYREFEASYEYEAENGLPHLVSGLISSHASDVDRVLQKVFGTSTLTPSIP